MALETERLITLEPLKTEDREQFIKDNQEAFNYGALEEFGRRDDHFEEERNIWILYWNSFQSWTI